MRRVRFLALAAGLAAAAVGLTSRPAEAQGAGQWSTIKGQVVFPAGKPIPERKKLEVSQDKEHCLSKGPILDESVVVNPKNRGIKNVVVWLRPDDENPKAPFPKEKVHPADAQRKPAEVVIDQPCCMFTPRITIARVGDTIVVKNPAPVAHNFFFTSTANGDHNPTIPKESAWKMPEPLKPEASAIPYKCSIHPWMDGYVRVFDHPYYAVTDDEGNFEIKNAPAGKWRVVMWHEKVGFLGGREGRLGTPIEVAGATTAAKPTEFDVTGK
jgi:hypothetical protein